ncbi:MAG TPA: hypothetical protein VN861_03255 [Candidatus Acidoferrales bacterium]|nr:hypothetical protein [Candidatus Acidoferrales bacterium]
MPMLTLHNDLNQSGEVYVDSTAITSVTPFGSGAAIGLRDAPTVTVAESPSMVAAKMRGE